ncbi:sulfurtransferase TusA family protein [Enterovirga rhinocerotis]|uniref:tRNA 2-thiouridine synthesizing protein A n=1 Tax=Enterovirga rhinocerotis TaxID=1339210 RepID=A0A4R7C4S8_9HYPH|nr:sulfurtransferase TusA family protein [Enterovirga rhinocerotis]TDR93171.1 tRNA 2-thiouridine synthesizing protein A [Enterovirga rhinocerotis]
MNDHPTALRLDLRGLKCPLPALRTRKALQAAAPGTVLRVECTDPLSRIDLPHLVRETGDVLEGIEMQGEVAVFIIRRSAA